MTAGVARCRSFILLGAHAAGRGDQHRFARYDGIDSDLSDDFFGFHGLDVWAGGAKQVRAWARIR